MTAWHLSLIFFHKLGWRKNEPWGFAVTIPKKDKKFSALAKNKKQLPLKSWRQMGIKIDHGNKKTNPNWQAKLLLPFGINGPAFLVLHNFGVLKIWNNSTEEAIEIGIASNYYRSLLK